MLIAAVLQVLLPVLSLQSDQEAIIVEAFAPHVLMLCNNLALDADTLGVCVWTA